MESETLPGLILRSQSGFFTVETARGLVTARLRGRLKQGRIEVDLAAVGDRVQVSIAADRSAMIEEVEPRSQSLVRLAPTARGVYQQVLLANLDQIILVFACANPAPHLRMLDRFLVIAEKQRIPALVIANKVDIVGEERAREQFHIYPPLGYEVIFTSAKAGLGVEDLRERLHGRISGMAGPSGVGKTSLLNAVQPELGLHVREVSQSTSKGRHTTQVRQLYPLGGGGYLADLPGLRALSLWDTEPEELDGYFREIAPLVHLCQFSDCTHQNEPGCAVRAAMDAGKIDPERYDSYLRLRFGE